jgi:5,6-dimethylbenzimidazole synthase
MHPSSVEIRRAGADDWAAVAALRSAAAQPAADGGEQDEPTWRTECARHTYVVAWSGADPIGLVGSSQAGDGSVALFGLWVAPAARRAGIGRRLLDEALAVAAGWGAPLVQLWVSPANEAALSLYRTAGFAPTGARQRMPGQPEEEILLAWHAPPPPLAPLYEVLRRRRDVRGEFSGAPLDDAVLGRVLAAAHGAPSVGLSQPWDFVVVEDRRLREAFREHVHNERAVFAHSLEEGARGRFAGIKIEGILEASCGVVVTYDPERGAPAVLGRHAIADAGLYSVCLAIENLWLAATAEGWGVGWVSFYREAFLADLVGLPVRLRPVAWLCLGPVRSLATVPDLERHGWRARRPLRDALHRDRWEGERPWAG